MTDFEEVLEQVGSQHRWQWTRYFLLSVIRNAVFMLLPMFGELAAPHGCSIPILQSYNWTFYQIMQFSSPTVRNDNSSDPYWNSTTKQLASCEMYVMNYSNVSPDFQTAMAQLSNVNELQNVSCTQGYIFDLDLAHYRWSYATDFELVCNKRFMAALPNTGFMLGRLTGLFVGGWISDKFGRRPTGIVLSFLTIIVGFLNSAAWEVYTLSISRFFTACLEGSRVLILWVWCCEVFGVKSNRILLGSFGDLFWTVNASLFVLGAYFVQNWRLLNAACTIPSLLTPLLFCFMPESPRWLVARQRNKSAIKVLHEIARTNKRPVPSNLIAEALHVVDTEAAEVPVDKRNLTYNYWTLLKTPNLRKRWLLVLYIWFSISMLYFGFTFASVTLPGNIYTNALINNLSGLLSMVFTYLIMRYFGRRKPQLFCYLGIALFSVLAILCVTVKDETVNQFAIVLATIGKCFCDAIFTIIYLYTTELMPTVVRNLGACSGSAAAGLGGSIAPMINLLDTIWPPLTLLVFAAVALIGAVATFFLPETTGKPLPQLIEDIEEPQSHCNTIAAQTKTLNIDSKSSTGSVA